MRHATPKLIIAATVLVAAVALLGYAGVQRGWVYYMDLDAFLAETRYHDQRVRLNGLVAEVGADIQPAQLIARFDLTCDAGKLPVVYRGVVPPMFKPGSQVVVEGKLDDAGSFQADVLMTKCASKYQADEHDKTLEQMKNHPPIVETPR